MRRENVEGNGLVPLVKALHRLDHLVQRLVVLRCYVSLHAVDELEHIRRAYKLGQCDKMDELFFHYFVICKNGNEP